jgi:hypothetical protein
MSTKEDSSKKRDNTLAPVPLVENIYKDIHIEASAEFNRTKSKLKRFIAQIELYIAFNS